MPFKFREKAYVQTNKDVGCVVGFHNKKQSRFRIKQWNNPTNYFDLEDLKKLGLKGRSEKERDPQGNFLFITYTVDLKDPISGDRIGHIVVQDCTYKNGGRIVKDEIIDVIRD